MHSCLQVSATPRPPSSRPAERLPASHGFLPQLFLLLRRSPGSSAVSPPTPPVRPRVRGAAAQTPCSLLHCRPPPTRPNESGQRFGSKWRPRRRPEQTEEGAARAAESGRLPEPGRGQWRLGGAAGGAHGEWGGQAGWGAARGEEAKVAPTMGGQQPPLAPLPLTDTRPCGARGPPVACARQPSCPGAPLPVVPGLQGVPPSLPPQSPSQVLGGDQP